MSSKYFADAISLLGDRQDYFPGTGGNISLKLQDESMLIKASGKRIIHMNEEDGVVSLSYLTVRKFYVTVGQSKVAEKESSIIVMDAVDKASLGRPSIETGFHALLSGAVIHSHSVYVNIFACSSSFEKIAETIFMGTGISYLCIGYAMPGYYLTQLFLDRAEKLSNAPRVIFMKNHGVVISAPTMMEAIALHELVTEKISFYFGCTPDEYPRATLQHLDDGSSKSSTSFLVSYVFQHIDVFKNIQDHILFPDLTVFCNDIVIAGNDNLLARILFNTDTNEIVYRTTKKEAHCIEENLIAFAFLYNMIQNHNLHPVFISEQAAQNIRNMEQEKYRKMLLEK